MVTGCEGSYSWSTGLLDRISRTRLIAVSCSWSQCHGTSSLSKLLSGAITLDLSGMKGDRKFSIPINRLTPSLSWGSGISTIALTLAGSGFNPSLLMTTPMYTMEVFLSWTLRKLNFTPYWMARSSTLRMILSCSCSSAAAISMSSAIMWTPSISPNTW